MFPTIYFFIFWGNSGTGAVALYCVPTTQFSTVSHEGRKKVQKQFLLTIDKHPLNSSVGAMLDSYGIFVGQQ